MTIHNEPLCTTGQEKDPAEAEQVTGAVEEVDDDDFCDVDMPIPIQDEEYEAVMSAHEGGDETHQKDQSRWVTIMCADIEGKRGKLLKLRILF